MIKVYWIFSFRRIEHELTLTTFKKKKEKREKKKREKNYSFHMVKSKKAGNHGLYLGSDPQGSTNVLVSSIAA